jgi:bacterioferritin-associated ferredoxin
VFVCICNAYRESHVREAINQASSAQRITAEQVYARLGKHPRCGRCLTHVQNLISDATRDKATPPLIGRHGL